MNPEPRIDAPGPDAMPAADASANPGTPQSAPRSSGAPGFRRDGNDARAGQNRDRRPPQNRRDRNGRPAADAPRGQAAAINRSRPIYDDVRGVRGRNRNGWSGNGAGRGPARGPAPSRRGGVPQRGFEEDDRDAPQLPANPREAALRVLQAVDTRSVFSDRLLDGAHERAGADPRDLALLHELAKGTLRWRGRLDHILDPLVHIGLQQTQPWVRNILRLGAYQILFLDRVPPHAAVDESVKLAHKYSHPGAAGLVNSVLRRLADEKDSLTLPEGDDAVSLAAWGSHPLWIVERWLARFGPEATRALMLANNRPIPVGLRVNALKGTREQLIERLAAEEVTARAATFSPDLVWLEGNAAPGAIAAFKQGYCTAQDESEALVGRLVAPQTHERLLDLCAAPGGKCTHLAELIGDEGEVWAMERAEARVASLQQTVTRLGAHSIHVVEGDGRSYAFPMPFDRALVDAPCSGLGVLGRRADARWRKGPEVLREMPAIQLDLLTSGGRRVRPGGLLVYSVCSFEPEETTQVVERFLRGNPAFVVESAAGAVPDAVLNPDGTMTVLPHVHGCDGAFAVRFRKT